MCTVANNSQGEVDTPAQNTGQHPLTPAHNLTKNYMQTLCTEITRLDSIQGNL